MRRWNTILLIVGIAALAGLVWHVGIDQVVAGVERLGWGFLLSSGAHGMALVIDAVIYKNCAGDEGVGVRYWVFLRAGLAAHAINTATPTGTLGEVSRYTMVRDHLSSTSATSAVVLLFLASSVGNFLFLAVALAGSAIMLDLPSALTYALLGGAGVFLVLTAVVLLLMRRGVGEWPFRLLRKVRVSDARVDNMRGYWHNVERTWKASLSDRRRLVTVLGCALLSRVATTMESIIILYYLGVSDVVGVALLAAASSVLVMWATGIIPYQAGSAEGSAYLLFQAIGVAPAVGVLMELVRKARRVVFVTIGIAVMGWHSFRDALWAAPDPDAAESDRAAET